MRCPDACQCECTQCLDGYCCRGKNAADDFDADELGLDPEEEYDA